MSYDHGYDVGDEPSSPPEPETVCPQLAFLAAAAADAMTTKTRSYKLRDETRRNERRALSTQKQTAEARG